MTKPIAYEANILASLAAKGAAVDADTLREWARQGEALRRRYEAACCYQWACTDAYEARTEHAEKALVAAVEAAGLHAHLQGDCRGATLYVDTVPLPRNAYTNGHCITPAERGQ